MFNPKEAEILMDKAVKKNYDKLLKRVKGINKYFKNTLIGTPGYLYAKYSDDPLSYRSNRIQEYAKSKFVGDSPEYNPKMAKYVRFLFPEKISTKACDKKTPLRASIEPVDDVITISIVDRDDRDSKTFLISVYTYLKSLGIYVFPTDYYLYVSYTKRGDS